MKIKLYISLVCALIAIAAFMFLAYVPASVPSMTLSTIFPLDFGKALWIERRLDVFMQVILVFTCAMGILVFFSGKDGN